MLNRELGSISYENGREYLISLIGRDGHIVYGPFQKLEPGRYVVEFDVVLVEGQTIVTNDPCGEVDVVGHGDRRIARADVRPSQTLEGAPIRLFFEVDRTDIFQFRFGTHGSYAFSVADVASAIWLEFPDDLAVASANRRYARNVAPPPFVVHNIQDFERLRQAGADIGIRDSRAIVTISDVSFYANKSDDIAFVDEVFFQNQYNLSVDGPLCVIDIGMNVGLTSMRFARQFEVTEVHSFEPFPSTYMRALENFELNPTAIRKIQAWNFGLSGKDEDVDVRLSAVSGANSIFRSDTGPESRIRLRKASTVLKPLFDSALGRGLTIVMKVDCEGSEFEIFEDLNREGLLHYPSIFLVEWHRIIFEKTQDLLIAPLRRLGFAVIDLSPTTGNGFFYAFKMGHNSLPPEKTDRRKLHWLRRGVGSLYQAA